jgi:8-oxo-dGTP diphosphatase
MTEGVFFACSDSQENLFMSKKKYTYDYPRPMVTVDAVVFAIRSGRLEVLLIERGNDPFAGMWALPGGFVEMDEDLPDAAARELHEETGVTDISLTQFRTFGEPGRDPRGRSVSVAYVALADPARFEVRSGDDAAAAQWHPAAGLTGLAFDHHEVVDFALDTLRVAADSVGVGRQVLPDEFSLAAFREVYETVTGQRTEGRALGRRMVSRGVLEPAGSGAYRFRNAARTLL